MGGFSHVAHILYLMKIICVCIGYTIQEMNVNDEIHFEKDLNSLESSYPYKLYRVDIYGIYPHDTIWIFMEYLWNISTRYNLYG